MSQLVTHCSQRFIVRKAVGNNATGRSTDACEPDAKRLTAIQYPPDYLAEDRERFFGDARWGDSVDNRKDGEMKAGRLIIKMRGGNLFQPFVNMREFVCQLRSWPDDKCEA